jgi:uncharacterized membrane protein YagU involved in acid resistance
MNVLAWLFWGFIATIVLTTMMAGAQSLRLTRMNIPYLLGTMLTPDRDRAKLFGFFAHLAAGWTFSFFYVAAFQLWGTATPWLGLLAGFVHASFVLVAGFPTLPAIHRRMASPFAGPTELRQLEAPGFMGLHYGYQTPLSTYLSHLVYGAILGGFYPL